MLKVLIVDDESIVREGFTYYICWKDFGCELTACCENGEDALKAFKANRIDIVITDIQMPKMDGFQLAKEIKEIDASAIVILLSAYSEFKYAQTALKLGIFDYILKPLDIDVFKETILKAVEFRKEHMNNLNSAFSLGYNALKDYNNSFYASIKNEENLLLQAIQVNNEELLTKCFENLRNKIVCNNFPLDYAKRWIFEFVIVLSHSSPFITQNIDNLYENFDPLSELSHLNNNNQAMDWLLSVIRNVISFIRDNSFNNKIINESLKIIHESYNDSNLSLNHIAKKLFISSNYLSGLFKEETGKNFCDYLIEYRIEKAKLFLRDASIKIYEVAERVGYGDPHYFSKLFKSSTGLTPKEYRYKLLA